MFSAGRAGLLAAPRSLAPASDTSQFAAVVVNLHGGALRTDGRQAHRSHLEEAEMKRHLIIPIAGLVAGLFTISACGSPYANTAADDQQPAAQEQAAKETKRPEAAAPAGGTAQRRGPWPAPGVPVIVESASKPGWTKFLATSDGRTLYRSDDDANDPSTSNCAGTCAETWMPVPADDVTVVEGVDEGLVGSLDRPDGTKQLTISNWPAYVFTGDDGPGDISGHGQDGTWFAMAPDGKKALTVAEAQKQEQSEKQAGVVVTDTKLPAFEGTILVDGDGRTMYRFDEDTRGAGTSACEASPGCDEKWPPVLADGGLDVVEDCVDPGLVSTFTRADGRKQVAIDGWPLYYFAKDKSAGDTFGHGVGGTWFAATGSGERAEQVGGDTGGDGGSGY